MELDSSTTPKRNSKSGRVTRAATTTKAKQGTRGTRKAANAETVSSATEDRSAETKAAEEARFDQAKARTSTTRKVDKSLDVTQLYLNEIGYSPLLTAD